MKTPGDSTRSATDRAFRADHAFVVQFETNCGFARDRRDDARGRVEHVISGKAARFASPEELLAFLAAVLRDCAVAAGEAK